VEEIIFHNFKYSSIYCSMSAGFRGDQRGGSGQFVEISKSGVERYLGSQDPGV